MTLATSRGVVSRPNGLRSRAVRLESVAARDRGERRRLGDARLEHVAAHAVRRELHRDRARDRLERDLRGRDRGVALPRDRRCPRWSGRRRARRAAKSPARVQILHPVEQARAHAVDGAREVLGVEVGARRDRRRRSRAPPARRGPRAKSLSAAATSFAASTPSSARERRARAPLGARALRPRAASDSRTRSSGAACARGRRAERPAARRRARRASPASSASAFQVRELDARAAELLELGLDAGHGAAAVAVHEAQVHAVRGELVGRREPEAARAAEDHSPVF